MTAAKVPEPFKLAPPGIDPFRRRVIDFVENSLEGVIHFKQLNRIYFDSVHHRRDGHFVDKVLDVLGVACDVAPEHLERIPRSGPLMVVANHPFGMVEGVALVSTLLRARPDVRVLANNFLGRMPELHEHLIFVDPFGGPAAARANAAGLRAGIEWLRQGGVLAMFPAGEVSSLNVSRRIVTDPPWAETAARLVRRTGVPVLPVFIEGRNSALFQLAGLVHPRLRTFLLPHALVARRRQPIHMRIGRPVPFDKLSRFDDDRDLTHYLRLRTYILGSTTARVRRRDLEPATQNADEGMEECRDGGRATIGNPSTGNTGLPASISAAMAPIIDPVDPAALAADVAGLRPEQKLAESGGLAVYAAEPRQIPNLLREIGRLREVTFRLCHEGTGKSIDLDRFDEYYEHLFVWSAERRELIGGYRIGRTDDILRRFGPDGLYTSTLFDISARVLKQIGPSLELGRSFVRPEQQRSYTPLGLLWKGIGCYAAGTPRYRNLFGPVSINNQYDTVSKRMMLEFLRANSYEHDLARHIRPRNPPRLPALPQLDLASTGRIVSDIDDVSALISEIEQDQKGVPILLKQYLRLGARLLGFNVDPDFGYVIDGLILVDLTRTERRILEHYMGRDGAERFFAYHAPR